MDSGEAMSDWTDKPEMDRTTIGVLRTAIGDAAFTEMRGKFVEDLQNLHQRYGEAVASGDTQAQRETAHALKGAAANIGLQKLAALAACLETETDLDAARAEMSSVFQSAISALEMDTA